MIEEPELKKTNKLKSSLGKYTYILAIGLMLFLGASYGLTFFVQNKKVAEGSITLGNVTINETNDKSINITRAVPENNNSGIKTYSKEITIENTSNFDANAKIELVRTSGLEITDFKYAIFVDGVIDKIDDVPADGIIYDKALLAHESKDIDVRLWVKEEYMGSTTTFVGSLNTIYGIEPMYAAETYTTLNNNTNNYVYFKCLGNAIQESSCEKWRIKEISNGRLVLTDTAHLSNTFTDSLGYDSSLVFDDIITSASTDGYAFYLNKTVKIIDGDGTESNPFVLEKGKESEKDYKVVGEITYYVNENDTVTQKVYYGRENYISQKLDDEYFQGWSYGSPGNEVNFKYGDLILDEIDLPLYGVIKKYLSTKINNLCNDSNVSYVQKYSKANGQPTDAIYELNNEDVCYYTSTSQDRNSDAEKNGNVILGDYCWQIVRTTSDGGIRLIYNGLKTLDNKCTSDADSSYSSNPRPSTPGFTGSSPSQTYLTGNKEYGKEFVYDGTGFTIYNTFTANWNGDYDNDGNIDSDKIIGTFTCNSLSVTCTSLYYVGSYYDSNYANTIKYTVGTVAHYSQIGTSPFSVDRDSPAYVGYMYDEAYPSEQVEMTIETDIIEMHSMTSSTAYYYGDTANWNSSTNKYELKINGSTPSSTTTWSSIRSTVSGMYTCGNATDTSCSTVYYIEAGTSSYMFRFPLSNNESADTKSFLVGTGYQEVGGNYELTGTTSLLFKNWYANRSQSGYKNVYICSDLTSSTCSTLYYVVNNTDHKIICNSSEYKIIYANSYIYQNGEYKLKLDDNVNNPYQEIWDWGKKYNTLSNSHYTCFTEYDSTTNSCGDHIYYISFANSTSPYVVTLTGNKSISEMLDEMLNTSGPDSNMLNNRSSVIKKLLENWAYHNIGFESMISTMISNDTDYCYDRTIKELNGWNPTGSIINSLKFKYNISPSKSAASLACSNVTDRFSRNNDYAKLSYSVGLLSSAEHVLMYSGYARTGQNYWLGTPDSFGSIATVKYSNTTGNGSGNFVSMPFGIRPVITIKPYIEFDSGSGTYNDPYFINTINGPFH